MTASPPGNAEIRLVIRPDAQPLFQYPYVKEYEDGGPHEQLYSTACGGVDC